MKEVYEGEIYDYIHNDIKNKLVFDIGANIGQMVQRFVKKECKVVAVEPQRELTLNDNYKGVYSIEYTCVGDKVGEIKFFRCERHCSSSCLESWHENRHPKKGWSQVIVPITTVDELIKKYGKPKYIKIDVEGFEDQVLSGLTQKIDLISFEFVDGFTENAIKCVDIIKKKFGFKKLITFLKKKIKTPKGKILHAYTSDITNRKYMIKYFNNFHKLTKKANRDVGDILVIL